MITPNIRGYMAGLLDIRGNAYVKKPNTLVLYVSGVSSPALQRDLMHWTGGGSITVKESSGDRRGCTVHCDHPHIEFRRTAYRWTLTGFRAVVVLHTLEPSLFNWADRFRDPYLEATEPMPLVPVDQVDEMARLGWDIP